MIKNAVTGATSYLIGPNNQVVQPQIDRSKHWITYAIAAGNISDIVVAPLEHTHGGWALGPGHIVAQGEVAQPAFTPDSRWVSYLQADGNGFSLYVVPAAGGQATRLSDVGSDMDSLSRPFWIP